MDKNTVLGLVLMGLVIFGFTMLNSPEQESSQPTPEQTEKAETKKQAQQTVDSLNADEWQKITRIVTQYGEDRKSVV